MGCSSFDPKVPNSCKAGVRCRFCHFQCHCSRKLTWATRCYENKILRLMQSYPTTFDLESIAHPPFLVSNPIVLEQFMFKMRRFRAQMLGEHVGRVERGASSSTAGAPR